MHVAEAPATREELGAALSAAAEAGTPVRLRGGGTKLAWTRPAPPEAIELSTLGLNEIVEHNAGDLTAVLEPGVLLADAQATFAKAGQMLALDPPDGGATVGGVVATADTGPLRARYGSPRDLVVGMRVALSDGTLSKSGGKVIKNVAGYDIAKLFTGSFGTLGAIVELSVRLHPLPPETTTATGSSADADELARGAAALAQSALEQYGLDVRWESGRGTVLVPLRRGLTAPAGRGSRGAAPPGGALHRDRRRRRLALGRAAGRPARAARGEGLRASHPPARPAADRGRAGRVAGGPRRPWSLVAEVRGAVGRGGRAPEAGMDRRGAGPAGGARTWTRGARSTRPPKR